MVTRGKEPGPDAQQSFITFSKPKVNTRVLEDSPTIHTSLPMVSQPLAAAVSAVETSGSRGVREWDKGFLLGEI